MAKVIDDPVQLGLDFGLRPSELLMNKHHTKKIKMVIGHKSGRILIPERNFQCDFNDKHNGHTALMELYDQGIMSRTLLFDFQQRLFRSTLPEIIIDGELTVKVNDIVIDYRHA